MVIVDAPRGRVGIALGELAKVPAFLRRDFLVAWSYRMAFFTDWLNLGVQLVLFYLVSLMVDPAKLPTFGGSRATYMEFVVVGIALGLFVALALLRVASGMRQEQLAGTLESLLMTPTAPATIQIGTVAYDIVYVPLRTSLFLLIVAVAFGLDLEPSGIAPALIALLAFIPFVWGLGLVTAATMLTYRRGIGVVGFAATGMALTSGAYFPLELLPEWLTSLFQLNPMTITINAMREGLLAGISWSELGAAVAKLAPMSAASLSVGVFAFRLAMRRERRRGSLGLY